MELLKFNVYILQFRHCRRESCVAMGGSGANKHGGVAHGCGTLSGSTRLVEVVVVAKCRGCSDGTARAILNWAPQHLLEATTSSVRSARRARPQRIKRGGQTVCKSPCWSLGHALTRDCACGVKAGQGSADQGRHPRRGLGAQGSKTRMEGAPTDRASPERTE